MSLGRYALGVGSLTVVCASLGLAAVAIRRRYVESATGALARLAEVAIGFALLTAELELLGTIGLFRLAPIVIGSMLIGLVLTRSLAGGASVRVRRIGTTGARSGLAVTGIAGAVAALAVLAEWAGPTFSSFDFGIRSFDSIWYHLPWAASFAQTGQVTGLRFTDVEYLTAFYPATAEMFHGAGIVALGRDTLSPIFNLVWLGLVLLAAYCVGRPRGVGALTTAAAAVALGVPMFDLSQAGSAANDIVGVFFVLAAGAFVFNAEERPALSVLGGVAAGLAIAVKLSVVIPALALTIGATVLLRRRYWLWLLPFGLAAGFWYLRNLIAVGNPLPWIDLPGLATPAQPLQAHTGFSVAHYLFSSHAWSAYLEPGLASGLGPWWWAVLALMLLGPLLALLPGADLRLRIVALVALASTVGYLLTPETAAGPAGQPLGFAFNLRYAAPALALSLTLLPLAPAFRGERARRVLLAALSAVLFATLAQARLWPSRQLLGVLAIVAAALVIMLVARRSGTGAVLAAALIVVLAGYPLQRHYLHRRYAFQPGISYLSRTWDQFRAVHGARVGLVGTFGGFFGYPYAGLDLSNRVQYVGARGPHGSFTAITSCRAWRTAVNAGHFTYLVTTPARDPWHPKPLAASPETRWTASDPAARLVYGQRATGQPIAIFVLHGSLNAAGCR